MIDEFIKELKARAHAVPANSPLPDLAVPKTANTVLNGYDFVIFNGAAKVHKACTSSVFSAMGWCEGQVFNPTYKLRAKAIYSTELLAWQAARFKLSEELAKVIANMQAADKRIEELDG